MKLNDLIELIALSFFPKTIFELFSRVLEYGECKKNQNGIGSCP
jgi:hypothetical protein